MSPKFSKKSLHISKTVDIDIKIQNRSEMAYKSNSKMKRRGQINNPWRPQLSQSVPKKNNFSKPNSTRARNIGYSPKEFGSPFQNTSKYFRRSQKSSLKTHINTELFLASRQNRTSSSQRGSTSSKNKQGRSPIKKKDTSKLLNDLNHQLNSISLTLNNLQVALISFLTLD